MSKFISQQKFPDDALFCSLFTRAFPSKDIALAEEICPAARVLLANKRTETSYMEPMAAIIVRNTHRTPGNKLVRERSDARQLTSNALWIISSSEDYYGSLKKKL